MYAVALVIAAALSSQTKEIRWEHLSSRNGDLPSPGTSREQTGVLTGRFDRDSPATDFVMSFRVVGSRAGMVPAHAQRLGPLRDRKGVPPHRSRRRFL